jgi:hypothetical protein
MAALTRCQDPDLLRGGELLLTSGIALPDDAAGLARYEADLASVGVSARRRRV